MPRAAQGAAGERAVKIAILGVAVTGILWLMFLSVDADAATGPINVTATLATSATVRLPPSGRRSDVTQQTWRLNDREGTRVGRLLLSCRWIQRRVRFCNGEITMPLGRIQVQGSSPTSFLSEFTVIGGSGVYLGGEGTMRLTAIGDRKSSLFVTIAQ